MQTADANELFDNRYHIISCLGKGGMAEVYKAYDFQLDHLVAIKILLPEYSSDEAFVERFMTEAKSTFKTANLDKLHTVGILDWGFFNEQCYIAMEYVDGPNLKMLLNEFGAFSAFETARIASQVCSALESAHAYGIIHRDIKPSNIILKRSTGDIKVADFGIALANRAQGQAQYGVAGTVQYMSPEQIRGEQLTYPSDIFSLGVTMFEMCCDTLPFSSDEVLEAAKTHTSLYVESPSVINPAVDEEFSKIVTTCLQTNPGNRFTSARKAKEALLEYTTNHADGNQPAQARAAKTWLIVFIAKGMQKHNAYKLNGETILGRGPEADIQIASPAISKTHARLKPEGTFLRVEDLGSTNGTLINGEPVLGSARCFPGDTITIGPTNLKVVCER